MGLRAIVEKIRRRPAKDEEGDMPPSIVLLLREYHLFSKAELEAAGERAWRKRFDGQEDPMFFVVQSGAVTMMKAGAYVVQILCANRPYSDDPDLDNVAQLLPRMEQKKFWLQHRAWASLDFWNQDRAPSEAYAVLARLAIQLGDSNCAAVYLPEEQLLFPNDGTAEEGLRRMIEKHRLP